MTDRKITLYYRPDQEMLDRSGKNVFSTGYGPVTEPLPIEGPYSEIHPFTKDRLGRAWDQGLTIDSFPYFFPEQTKLLAPIIGVYGRNVNLDSKRLEFVIFSRIPKTNFGEGHRFNFDGICELVQKGYSIMAMPANSDPKKLFYRSSNK